MDDYDDEEDDGIIDVVEAAAEVIKRTYRSWRFSDRKVTVAEVTALALMHAGLLNEDAVFADYAEIPLMTVGGLLQMRDNGELS